MTVVVATVLTKKPTKSFLNKKYDELYEKAVELNKKHYCCIRENSCRGSIDAPAKGSFRVQGKFCCEWGSKCKHLGKNGCTVKALRCKMWFCHFVHASVEEAEPVQFYDHPIYEGIPTPTFISIKPFLNIVEESRFYGFTVFRGTKKANLENAYKKWGLNGKE